MQVSTIQSGPITFDSGPLFAVPQPFQSVPDVGNNACQGENQQSDESIVRLANLPTVPVDNRGVDSTTSASVETAPAPAAPTDDNTQQAMDTSSAAEPSRAHTPENEHHIPTSTGLSPLSARALENLNTSLVQQAIANLKQAMDNLSQAQANLVQNCANLAQTQAMTNAAIQNVIQILLK